MSLLSADENNLPPQWTGKQVRAANVRTMTPSEPAGERAHTFYAIWQNARKDRLAPKRRDLTLSMVRKLSAWVWVAEILDGGRDYRFRLTGDGIVRFFDRNVTGFRLSQFADGLFVRNLRLAFDTCLHARQPVVFGPVATGYVDKDFWEMETLVLPLSETGEGISALMGAFELTRAGFLRSQP
jgi:hypothetical protein